MSWIRSRLGRGVSLGLDFVDYFPLSDPFRVYDRTFRVRSWTFFLEPVPSLFSHCAEQPAVAPFPLTLRESNSHACLFHVLRRDRKVPVAARLPSQLSRITEDSLTRHSDQLVWLLLPARLSSRRRLCQVRHPRHPQLLCAHPRYYSDFKSFIDFKRNLTSSQLAFTSFKLSTVAFNFAIRPSPVDINLSSIRSEFSFPSGSNCSFNSSMQRFKYRPSHLLQ
jgi:hypothetical protein